MKASTLTSSAREKSRDIANLAQLEHDVIFRLTQNGPVLRPGSIMFTAEAFQHAVPAHLWTALALHECGNWGACGVEQAIKNQLALIDHGQVLSRWHSEFDFMIQTRLAPDEEQTTVSLSAQSLPVPEASFSAVYLGDVLLDESVYPVPYKHIWFALREHEMASPGDTDLLPRQSSHQLGSTALSLWAHPYEQERPFLPFWVLTHLNELRLTFVFASSPSNAL